MYAQKKEVPVAKKNHKTDFHNDDLNSPEVDTAGNLDQLNLSRLNLSEEGASDFTPKPEKILPEINSDLISLSDIRSQGTLLGSGIYGTAYKLNNNVYKIYNEFLGGSLGGMGVKIDKNEILKKNAIGWNHFYRNAYKGKYSEFANAEVVKTTEKEFILRTPYINGASLSRNEYIKSNIKVKLENELKLLNKKLTDNNSSNVKIIDNDALIIDFDLYEPMRNPYKKKITTVENEKYQAAREMSGF